MNRPNFENLEVYRLAEQLSDEIWRIVARWQRLPQATIGAQMIRAADGVGANIAEGTGRITYRDNRRFIGMARGSLYETMHWLRRACLRGLLGQEEITRMNALTTELAPRLNAYLRAISNRCRQSPRQAEPSTDI